MDRSYQVASVKDRARIAEFLSKEGLTRMKKQAQWLEVEYPSPATSLLEGLEETFTVNRLGLSGLLRRSLSTTNIIENPNSVVRRADAPG